MIDLVGQKFTRLTVISMHHLDKYGNRVWLCKCDCGSDKEVYATTAELNIGQKISKRGKKSCGCLQRERSKKANTTHGKTYTLEYKTWEHMKVRCSENNKDHEWYFDKGITICERWLDPTNGFTNFLEDMGPRPFPKATLDRIDSSKEYSKDNCRWLSIQDQQRNRSNVKLSKTLADEIRIKYNSGNFTQHELAILYNISNSNIWSIINNIIWI
jgi:hypothetical protein